ncbi:hypothetical protein PLICRDRAFT_119852 [Plicaturopsis crispa FD-325 SS-3]|uniref:Unplaced genomic scaffold PLICRscaffold_31, whole genome shotgun sequence n=1 Tax=Plicaturopsis crispa FD-325 SS-3 TaxID=944288 RepID=A0A0C9SPX4_PLICR|nr:hypothetical protein PLICRDRAFT_119852 [Plicaturopsis crispa FD-325 SS-3]
MPDLTSSVQLPWDAEHYNTHLGARPSGQQYKKEASLQSRYPALRLSEGVIDQPITVVDIHGVILLWYMPRALTASRQDNIIQHTSKLSQLFGDSMKNSPSGNWRTASPLFAPAAKCPQITPGCISISPGWFHQAHDTAAYPLEPSATFKGKNAKTTLPWLTEMAESFVVINTVMGIIHPDLYDAGRETLRRIHTCPEASSLAPVLHKWASIFNGAAIISNRETLIHRDNFSRAEWYDLLATVGRYRNAVMEIPVAGLRLDYSGGTLVGIAGQILSHGVSRADGKRLCLAFYMRDNVQERMEVRGATWMDYGVYGKPEY